ncbi:fumarylacetoacetate hydrolase family protein [Herbiconiux solani]|uniref:fumarylacetoacetate hydrolase family protein n=1 Tax=Herbiconiux solani TaxID=661329 RepID=UPI000825391F|nr:fumarylacetoacetate hydrolase family protein [Herbiconiux solani]
MRFLRIGAPGAERPAVEVDGIRYDISAVTDDIDGDFLTRGYADLEAALAAGELPVIDEGDRIGAPIARPGKIVCIGLNYRDHAEETGAAIPGEPVVFMKDPMTMVGPFDDILIPRASTKTDWEVELGVVIGETARYLESPAAARAHIAGYVLSHDVSEREFQLERGGQWDKGKSCETFNPLGPVLVTADEIADPQDLGLRLWVDGVQRQNGSTANMIFPVEYVIWYLSQFMVLYPGDLVNTGTPAGVALGIPGNPYLRAGSRVALEIDGLGRSEQGTVQA